LTHMHKVTGKVDFALSENVDWSEEINSIFVPSLGEPLVVHWHVGHVGGIKVDRCRFSVVLRRGVNRTTSFKLRRTCPPMPSNPLTWIWV
jgi:hypothetical protein